MWGRRVAVAMAGFVVGVAALCRGQVLVDKVPDDAMVYVGWKGSESMGDAYAASHLKAVVESSDWRQAFDEFLPALIAKAGQKDASAAEKMRVLSTLGAAAWRHESAFYFGGVIAGQRGGPPAPKLAVLVRAGADAPALLKQVNDAIDKAGRTPFPIKAEAYGDLVAVTTGSWPGFDALLGAQVQAPAAPALKGSEKFNAALSHVRKDPVATVYVDADAIVKMVDGFIALGTPPTKQRDWRKLRQVIGLGGLRQAVFVGGFDGKDWATEGFVGAPAPRAGLLALKDARALSDDALRLVPQDAVMVSARRLDFGQAVSVTRNSIAAADADQLAQFDRLVAQANLWAGLDIEHDVLATLGDEWAAYVSPSVGGNGFLGLCVASKLKDAQKAEASLGMLEKRVTDEIQRRTRGEPVIAFKSRTVGDVTVHYLALPLVTPSWAVVDGNLYLAFYPQVVTSAAAYAKSGGRDILRNQQFAATLDRLGHRDAAYSISFADLPRTAPNAYPAWLLLSRYAGFADLFGVDSPLMLIPPIDRLTPELAPAGSVEWVDDAGWHLRGVSPFPASGIIAQDPVGTIVAGQPVLAAAVLLPALNRAHVNAARVKGATNLHVIGQAMLTYSNDHQGKFPATLGQLAEAQNLPPSTFVNPASGTPAPADIQDKAKLVEWVNESSDYVYLGSGKDNHAAPDVILAYENPAGNKNEGMSILFGDGHVEWKNFAAGTALIEAQRAKDAKQK